MELIVLSQTEWKPYSEIAHKLCFNETGYSDIEICDYALMVVDHDTPLMYATIRRHDSATAYMARGGAFPSSKGTALSYKAFDLILNYLKQTNSAISMRVENKNTAMLKFAIKAGFLIDGISYHKNKIYLEHFMEVNNVVDATSCNKSNGNEPSEKAS